MAGWGFGRSDGCWYRTGCDTGEGARPSCSLQGSQFVQANAGAEDGSQKVRRHHWNSEKMLSVHALKRGRGEKVHVGGHETKEREN